MMSQTGLPEYPLACPRCAARQRDLDAAELDYTRLLAGYNDLVRYSSALACRLETLVSADVVDACRLWSQQVTGADKQRAELLLSQLKRARP